MKKINILLGDPRHKTVGFHSHFVPINIGYIASHIINQFKNNKSYKIEVKLSTDTDEIFNLIESENFNIIALSSYIWNSQLSNFICEKAKKKNTDTLCIMGGPEFPAGTGAKFIENTSENRTYDKCFNFLTERLCVDYFAWSDGEVAILDLVNSYIENDFSSNKMRKNNIIVKGCTNLSNDKKKLLVGDYIARIGMEGSAKSGGRDLIPSPYTTGLLDKFLNGKYTPAFETARGCPFLCTFCDQGLDKSKIAAFSVERLAEEIKYVGEKISKIPDGTKSISMFDSNWGIFQKDVDLAHEILKVMNKYDWPQYIECLTPKSNWKNILKINDILKNRVELTLSMQSTNDKTLSYIKRTNWTTDQYLEFIKHAQKKGKPQLTEMIIPLPGETEETYFEGVQFMMENHVQTRTFGLMMLCGAELGRDRAIKKYELVGKHRILPKQFGTYFGKKLIETEEICVSTNTMNFQSYLNCRNYSFVLKLLGHPIFFPINKLLKKLNIKWYDFSRTLFDTLKTKEIDGKFRELYLEFLKKSQDELFDTKEECLKFYSDDANYKSIIEGNLAENLAAKYVVKGIINYNEVLDYIFKVIKITLRDSSQDVDEEILESSKKWLLNLYLINEIVEGKPYQNNYTLDLDFDFPNWLKDSKSSLAKYKYNVSYKISFEDQKIQKIRNEIYAIFGVDQISAFERFLERRHMTRFDLLEKNYQKIERKVNKSRVLFVYPNERQMSTIPPAIALLSQLLKQKGHTTDVFDTTFYEFEDDLTLEDADKGQLQSLQVRPVVDVDDDNLHFKKIKNDSAQDLRKKIIEFKPDLLAVSCSETTFHRGLRLISKTRDLGVKNIFGGVFPTFAPHLVMNFNDVDMVCVGEGEHAMLDLTDLLSKGEDYSNVTNLWIRKKDGSIKKNSMSKPVDINQLPAITDIGIFGEKRFYRPMGGKIRRLLPVETHRGCPYTCSFCNSPSQNRLYASHGSFFRKKSMKLIKEEIESHIKMWNVEYIYFWADTFLAWSTKEFDEFCEMYQDIKLPFWCQTRIETISRTKFKKLKEVGLHRITFGMEHGNEKFRREVVKRSYTNKLAIELMQIPTELDITFSVNNIIGFPGETRELAFDTIELNRHFKSDDTSCSTLIPFHGTEIREIALKEGLIKEDEILTIGNSSEAGFLDMPQWPKEEVAKLRNTFSMYVKFPRDRWPEIKKAEDDPKIYAELSKEFIDTYWPKTDIDLREAARGLF